MLSGKDSANNEYFYVTNESGNVYGSNGFFAGTSSQYLSGRMNIISNQGTNSNFINILHLTYTDTAFAIRSNSDIVMQSAFGNVLVGGAQTNPNSVVSIQGNDRGIILPQIPSSAFSKFGTITAINVTAGGSGYTSGTINVASTQGGGLVTTNTIVSGAVTAINVVKGGYGQNGASISITGGTGATATPVISTILPKGLLLQDTTLVRLVENTGSQWNYYVREGNNGINKDSLPISTAATVMSVGVDTVSKKLVRFYTPSGGGGSDSALAQGIGIKLTRVGTTIFIALDTSLHDTVNVVNVGWSITRIAYSKAGDTLAIGGLTNSSTIQWAKLSDSSEQASLVNSTISGVALGGNLNNLNFGYGFTNATSYNGSAVVNQGIDTTKFIQFDDSTGGANPTFVTLTYFNANKGATSWSLTGNSGTTPGTNFIGTTDNNDLVFERNSTQAGLIDAVNTYFGVGTPNVTINNLYNAGFGLNALNAVTNSGSENAAFGARSLMSLTAGSYNSALGYGSMRFNKIGSYNIAIGGNALLDDTIPQDNTVIGVGALGFGIGNTGDVAVGQGAASSSVYDTHSNYITAVGTYVGQQLTLGDSSILIGAYNSYSNSTGVNDILIGAGINYTGAVTTGANTTIIGSHITYNGANTAILSRFDQHTIIGAQLSGEGDSSTTLQVRGAITLNKDSLVAFSTFGSQDLLAIDTVTKKMGKYIGKIVSGSYTPTLTNTTNLTSNTLSQATYTQVGNIVTVTIGGTLSPTSGSSNTTLTITLPVNTATTTQSNVGSGSYSPNTGGNSYIGAIANIVSASTATMNLFVGTVTTTGNFSITFQYHTN